MKAADNADFITGIGAGLPDLMAKNKGRDSRRKHEVHRKVHSNRCLASSGLLFLS